MASKLNEMLQHARAWALREEHRKKAHALGAEIATAFTAHPHATGETYLEHLWFTFKLAMRFFYAMAVLIIHGLFPFLMLRAASNQIEIIYGIMKSRIPKARRDEIDHDYSV